MEDKIVIRRRCELCGVRLAVGLVEDNKLHCYCPLCGVCVTFTATYSAEEEAKTYDKPTKNYC